MRIGIVADIFLPACTSAAVQLRDLSLEFARQGHDVTVLVASSDISSAWTVEKWNGVRVVRLRTPNAKVESYARRAFCEMLMPFFMLYQLRKSSVRIDEWDGLVWYSPTIFLGPIVQALKSASKCESYLIVRDIFPEWAVDMGLMGRGLPYQIFKAVANYQYSVADRIGIQTQGNRKYFEDSPAMGKVEVLQNWLGRASDRTCSISIEETSLAGRKIFVYAGNMGVAQGTGVLMEVAERLHSRPDIGFLFVGRGVDVQRLKRDAINRGLTNILFFDEIEPDEIPALYAQCHVGLVALDPRHRTHNIPGKFLSYMQSGLPVLASINEGNDLVALIHSRRVGFACTLGTADALAVKAEELLLQLDQDRAYAHRCKALSDELFSPAAAVSQIISALTGNFGYVREGNVLAFQSIPAQGLPHSRVSLHEFQQPHARCENLDHGQESHHHREQAGLHVRTDTVRGEEEVGAHKRIHRAQDSGI